MPRPGAAAVSLGGCGQAVGVRMVGADDLASRSLGAAKGVGQQIPVDLEGGPRVGRDVEGTDDLIRYPHPGQAPAQEQAATFLGVASAGVGDHAVPCSPMHSQVRDVFPYGDHGRRFTRSPKQGPVPECSAPREPRWRFDADRVNRRCACVRVAASLTEPPCDCLSITKCRRTIHFHGIERVGKGVPSRFRPSRPDGRNSRR